MIINYENFQLKTSDESDESIRRITEIPEVAKNLTERWMYPAGMPDSIVFAILFENQVAGSCGLKTIRWFNRKAELSLFLDPDFQKKSGMPDSIVFAIHFENRVAGSCALKTIRWFNRKAELSLFLDPDFQKKGIGSKALLALMKHAFFSMNFYRLEAEIIEYNQPALTLIRKLEFIEEGRLRQAKYFDGKYYDILRFGILKPEFEAWLNNLEK